MPDEERPGDVRDRGHPTEDSSFDAVAEGLANGTIPRRKAVKLASAAILGGALSIFTLQDDADARRRKKKKPVPPSILRALAY